jgi:hypothetical protein
MIQALIEYVAKEWLVVKNAPATILVLIAIVAGFQYSSIDKSILRGLKGQNNTSSI